MVEMIVRRRIHTDCYAVYLFVGCIAIGGGGWYRYIPGSLVALVGLAYIAMEFVPSIEPPANMRDADAGWGAEQV
jgi:hypothetical protein